MTETPLRPLAETRAWVRRAVVGLNLCPFAKAPLAKDTIRYVLSEARSTDALRDELAAELVLLVATPETEVETTLLVHPRVLQDFMDFNDFLGEADDCVAEAGLEGIVQVASFHPQFQFAGTSPDDVGNATNQSPYPTLHLLRESSIDRAVAAFPEAEAIFEANVATMASLGPSGWAALRAACLADAADEGSQAPSG